MPRRLAITVVCFNISAVLSILLGLVLCAVWVWVGCRHPYEVGEPLRGGGMSFPGMPMASGVLDIYRYELWLPLAASLLLIAAGVIFRIVAANLARLRYWAWFVGLVFAGLMIFNGLYELYIGTVLGGLALWGLLDTETLAVFVPRSAKEPQ